MYRWLLLGVFLFACTPRPPVEVEWLKERSHRFTPDSLKAKGELTFRVPISEEKFDQGTVDAYFYVVPHQRYRVELKGPLGIHLGSILWNQGAWEAWLPQENLHIKGQGEAIRVPIPGLSEIAIHKLIGSLWGEVLPEGWQTAAFVEESQGSKSQLNLNWQNEGVQYQAEIHKELFQVKSVTYLNQEYRYYDWSHQDSLYFPNKTKIKLNRTQLEVEIDELQLKPKWNERLWRLRVPPGARVREML